jgi:predicted nuclease of predicted toxin-antitoxin system
VRFLVDNQLPPALARFIRDDLGCHAVHVTDVGLRDATDEEIWTYASKGGFIVISKDEDFVGLFLSTPSAGLLWVRVRNCRRAHLLDVFQRSWPSIMDRFDGGENFVEFR